VTVTGGTSLTFSCSQCRPCNADDEAGQVSNSTPAQLLCHYHHYNQHDYRQSISVTTPSLLNPQGLLLLPLSVLLLACKGP
jgi:hypothetical protein